MWANFVARNYEEAFIHLPKALELDSGHVYGHTWLSAALAKKGMVEESSAAAERA